MLFYIYPVINTKQDKAFHSCSADIILPIRKKHTNKQNTKSSTILSGRKKDDSTCPVTVSKVCHAEIRHGCSTNPEAFLPKNATVIVSSSSHSFLLSSKNSKCLGES